MAIAGAGALALAPLVVPPPALSALEHAVAQSVMRDAHLLATTTDLGGTFNASLEGIVGGLATALNLDVTRDVNGGVRIPDFIAALTAGFTGGASGMRGGLGDLLTMPITVITDLIATLTGGMTGGITNTIAQLIAAPIRFGLNSLMAGNDVFTGLLTGGIDTFSGLLAGGLAAGAGLLASGITLGSQFVGVGCGLG